MSILTSIGTFVLNWLWKKALDFVLGIVGFFTRQKEIKKESDASVDPLKKANPESEKEIDDATKGALDGF
jgi:hypothetical protein